MVIVLAQGTSKEQTAIIIKELEEANCTASITYGEFQNIIGVVGDTHNIDRERLSAFEFVEKVLAVQEPYKKANRAFHPENTVVTVKGQKIGDEKLAIIAGPCSVESESQIVGIAKAVKAAGANFLRGGAFKPRT